MTGAAARLVAKMILTLSLSAGTMLAQSEDIRATSLLKPIDAVKGTCGKAQRIDAKTNHKLLGVTFDITYDPANLRSLASYQDSTGRVPVYVETLTTIESGDVILRTIAARILPGGEVGGILTKIVLSPSAPKDQALADRPRTSRQLTTEERNRVRSLSEKVLQRCTNA
jgi:hypothetical protein